MACAAATSFHLPQISHPNPKIPKSLKSPPFIFLNKTLPKSHFIILHSIDVSKEDKSPTSSQPEQPVLEKSEPESEIEKRKLEEKFAVLNTGIYECRSCGFKYDESVGDPSYPIPPGLQFQNLPEDWRCPTCGASQNFFVSKSVEIAGFAANQQFGLGGNSLTSGQKTLLIYGTLLFFFALFLSGYFLQ
ncbi:Rubredoxin-like superfamily protein [Euphorbia peplus]|nr:Rubredoxin-like superfamily protein [Euphorbia peplus]